jgi:formylmethanofuran dehydrogenase subunit D
MRIPLKHKFNAVAVERDGFKFKSKMQRQRYDDLKLAQTAGDVVMFLQEVPFRMPGTVYWADFVVFWADGSCTVEDVKGTVTPTFKTKRRMMAIHYPAVDIICITYKRRKNTCA